MNEKVRRWTIMAGVGLVVALAMPAAANEPDDDRPRVETVSPDLGVGEHDHALAEEERFGDPDRLRGRVDRRHEFNPLATRNIGWPTGYIPPAGTLTYTNRLLFGQHVAVSLLDDVQITGYGFLPLGSQIYAGGGGRFRLVQEDAWTLTAGAQGRYRRTNFEPGTANADLGLHAVFDVVASDDTTWSAGASANIPLYLAVEEVDFSGCDDRRQWAEGDCGATARRSGWMPVSGHWVSLFAGINHFVTDRVILNVEAFSGISQGNFWALESALDSELTYSTELHLVEDSEWSSGLGPLGVFTLGLGTTVRIGKVAVQPSVYLTNYDGEATILPHLSMAISAGGGL